MPLPEAMMNVWKPDMVKNIGGIMQMAGVDTDILFVRSIVDHPWLGLEIEFPFPEVGKGKIIKCLTHPSGYLMFDVFFEEPVPPIRGTTGNYFVVLKDNPLYHQMTHRYYARELKDLIA